MSIRFNSRILVPLCLALSVTQSFAAPFDPAKVPPGPTPKEVEIGSKAAAEIEKDPKTKFLDLKVPANKAMADKLNAMVDRLGKVSLRPQIPYSAKIIDSDEVNAFTLPNGHIYVYRGLMELVGSDDELAAVMAHEIGHNAMMHALRGEQKAKPLNWVSIAALLAALTSKSGADVAAMTPYVLTGVMNGFTVEYEQEADKAAIHDMIKASYNPSALVTFMNRLSAEELRRPKVELGIFQDHPPSPERSASALAELKKLGIPFTPRLVEGAKQSVVTSAAPDKATVNYNGVTLMEIVTAPRANPDAKTRAAAASTRINDLMRNNLRLYELTVSGDDSGAAIVARGKDVIRITPADAKLQDTTPLALVRKWKENFNRLFWSETLKGNL